MAKFLKRVISDEKGQALPVVLALLVLGGLVIAPTLNYAATSLNISRTISEDIHGLYAASAGVEYALWCLRNGEPSPGQLPENINQMEVTLQIEEKGSRTLHFGELIESRAHSDYLSVNGGVVWDEGAQADKYTITVTWQSPSGTPLIHLEEVGVRLPPGYSYQPGSAALFTNNLSTGEPNQVIDALGVHTLNWILESPYPGVSEDNPIQTQAFYITGAGSQEGDYTWVVASRSDIGTVGEISGSLYRITATARRPQDGRITARIITEAILGAGTTYIISWQVSKG